MEGSESKPVLNLIEYSAQDELEKNKYKLVKQKNNLKFPRKTTASGY